MGDTPRRLASAVSLLALIQVRREETGDPNLGSNIERQLVDRELRELEAQLILDPGPLAKYMATPFTATNQATPKQ